MCWDYEQIICKQKAMTTMAILLGWTGDVHIAPLCFNTCREVCSSFMSSSLSPSQNCTPQFCFAFIQTFTAYLYHQSIISMKAELLFSSAYWRKAQWLPVVGTSLCTTEGSMNPAARGAISWKTQAIRLYDLCLLRTTTLCFSLHASLEFRGAKVVDLAHNSPPCLRTACFVSGWILWYHTSITWPCFLGYSCWDHRDFWPMPHQPISFWEAETGTETFQFSTDSLVELKEDTEPGVVRGSHHLPDGQGGWFREKWRDTIWKKYRCSSVVTFHLYF